MANTGIALANVAQTNTILSTDRLVACLANGAVRLVTAANATSMTQGTPGSSSSNCVQGQAWFDSSYFYIAVANNSIKRVPLDSF